MAARTPATSGVNTTFVRHNAVRGGTVGAAEDHVTDGTTYIVGQAEGGATAVPGMRLIIEYFSDIDHNDTWDTGYGSRLLACAVQADDPAADFIVARINAAGSVTFETNATSLTGLGCWCWILVSTEPGSDVPRDERNG